MNSRIKTADVLLLRVKEGNIQVLLTKRGPNMFEPNKWCIPGGHLNNGEIPLDGGIRELKEETNIDITPLKSDLQVYGIHPISTIRKGYGITYTCVLPPSFKYTLKPQSEETAEIKWFNHDEIPHDQMAFDHGDIVEGLIECIKQE